MGKLTNSQKRKLFGTCKRKIRHVRQIDALHALKVSPARANGAVAYQCDFCGGWHIGRFALSTPADAKEKDDG